MRACSLLRPRPIAFPPVFLIPVDWKVVAKGRLPRHLPDVVLGQGRRETLLRQVHL